MPSRRPLGGFTLIELLVALAIIATLLTLVVPRFFGGVTGAEEAVLKQNLATVRDALDKYRADTGRYPDALEELVENKYLRSVPIDPVTQSAATWVFVPSREPGKGAIADVQSGAQGTARDGTRYGQW
jgi:general secretion pathway protein G